MIKLPFSYNLVRGALALLFALVWDLQAAPENQSGSIIQVAFWNIRDFSVSSRDTGEFLQIARVVHTNDIIAICELNDDKALPKLCDVLETFGGKWKSKRTSKKIGNTTGSKEYYGFVYRSDKLWPRGSVRVLPQAKITIPGESAKYTFDREPAYCKFATLDGRLDFTLMVVHITWGDHERYRKAEVIALASYFELVQNRDVSDADVFVTGDFNQNAGTADSLGILMQRAGLTDTTSPTPPTVIKGNSTYDHILFDANHTSEYTGAHGVTRFDEDLFGNDDEKARLHCSDHRPVWVQLRVPPQDDD